MTDDAYQAVFQANCPLYDPTALVALGGWHTEWPGDDWEELSDTPLLVWTLYQAEPWFEVFQTSPTTFQVHERFT